MPRFKASLKKLDGKVVLEVPRNVAKSLGFDGNTEVLVDCKMVSTEKGLSGKQRLARNHEILRQYKEGIGIEQLADRFDLSHSTVSNIVEDMAEMEKTDSIGFHVSTKAVRVIAGLIGRPSPSVEEFKRYTKRNEDWRKWMLTVPSSGFAIIAEIEEFCRRQKIPL